jgi:hypothetical protein
MYLVVVLERTLSFLVIDCCFIAATDAVANTQTNAMADTRASHCETFQPKGFPTAGYMSHTMTNTCYFHGESAIIDIIPTTTNTGRNRVVSKMKWNSVVKFMHKKRGT